MRRLYEIIKYCFDYVLTKVSPNGYAKKRLGYLGENCVFYGMRPNMFGSEPWLISIGKGTEITANCQFITHDGSVNVLRKRVPDLEIVEPIIIGEECFIGIGTLIMGPTRIGNGCIVGAKSLVKGNFPANSVIAGVPAKVICSVDEYLERAMERSTHTGALRGKEREAALRKIRNIDL